MRYIDADAIDYKHHKQHKNGKFNADLLGDAKTLEDAFYKGVMYIHNCIEETPTADVVEVKHGEWIKFDEGDCYCSNCGIVLEDWVQGIFYKFCPYCGADMRGEDDE